MTTIRVDDSSTADELREALTWAAAAAAEIPDYCTERRARAHAVLDGWLTRLERAEA